jgi:predicted transposase YdaD
MSKPFDATTKMLVELRPGDWLALLGIPGANAEIMDADLATVTTEADRVIRAFDPDGITHIEFESGHRGRQVPDVLLRYSVLLTEKYDNLPVHSIVVLLRPASDSPALTGELVR